MSPPPPPPPPAGPPPPPPPSPPPSAPDWTYKLTWGGRFAFIKPIRGIPALHPTVQNQICGAQLKAGDPIPASGLWSEKGASAADGADCGTVLAGGYFYAFNYPTATEPNIGYNRSEDSPVSIYMVMDATSRVYFVMSLVAPSSAYYNKYITADFIGSGIGLQTDPVTEKRVNASVIVADTDGWSNSKIDPWDTSASRLDSSDSSGSTTATWRAVRDKQDGTVIGPLPASGFSLKVSIRGHNLPRSNAIKVGRPRRPHLTHASYMPRTVH